MVIFKNGVSHSEMAYLGFYFQMKHPILKIRQIILKNRFNKT